MLVSGSQPFPFIVKDGSLYAFKTISKEQFNNDFVYGDLLSGSYPLFSELKSYFYTSGLFFDGQRKKRLLSLKNTLNYYNNLSPHYAFSSSLGDKETQELCFLSIPSLLYGQSIRKRSVSCKWYHTGSLIAELTDINGNGELIQTGPSGSLGSGSVAGVILYNEGFIILTGSWDLHETDTDNFNIYDPENYGYSPAWKYFMSPKSDSTLFQATSSFFSLDFEGTEVVPTMTMFAKAGKGEFNHSNNPTYVKYGQKTNPFTGSNAFSEKIELQIKNIVDTPYNDEEPDFQKITYLSKVAIYDEEGNLIGAAKLANPIPKRENDEITIKMKLDL